MEATQQNMHLIHKILAAIKVKVLIKCIFKGEISFKFRPCDANEEWHRENTGKYWCLFLMQQGGIYQLHYLYFHAVALS